VAYALGKTVREIKELDYDELLDWYEYFRMRPQGWRDDDRAAKLIQAQGVKAKPWELFPSLKGIYNSSPSDKDSAIKSLQGSLMLHKMLGAKGGDKLDL
jgi:hypothetical protein